MAIIAAPAPIVQLTLVGRRTAAALRREARRRDVSAATLARDLLDRIAEDGLCAAVLDIDVDVEEPAPAP